MESNSQHVATHASSGGSFQIERLEVPYFSRSNRLSRALWDLVWLLLFRPTPRPMHAWRSVLLRAFGARLGRDCHFYPAAKVWAPWNLECGDRVGVADGAELYNP